jgi:hypothetical protein
MTAGRGCMSFLTYFSAALSLWITPSPQERRPGKPRRAKIPGNDPDISQFCIYERSQSSECLSEVGSANLHKDKHVEHTQVWGQRLVLFPCGWDAYAAAFRVQFQSDPSQEGLAIVDYNLELCNLEKRPALVIPYHQHVAGYNNMWTDCCILLDANRSILHHQVQSLPSMRDVSRLYCRLLGAWRHSI